MGYDQNNDYYSNGDQSWRDQTNVYQTQREQPTPMGSRRPRRRSGWLKGILAVLLVVAIQLRRVLSDAERWRAAGTDGRRRDAFP